MGQYITFFMTFVIAVSSAVADEKSQTEVKDQASITNTEPAEKSQVRVPAIINYVDENRDGVNDLFQDANGDGINDVTLLPYHHNFSFVDGDGDGINDMFVDRDGDGVNDLNGQFMDANGDGICDNVIDHNGDGINDVTGIAYHHRSLEGFRFGRMDEERGAEHHLFIDEDGDGMNDLRAPEMMHPVNGMDLFIDEDGDGICDGRSFLHPMMHMAIPNIGREERNTLGHMEEDSEAMDIGRKHRQMGGGK